MWVMDSSRVHLKVTMCCFSGVEQYASSVAVTGIGGTLVFTVLLPTVDILSAEIHNLLGLHGTLLCVLMAPLDVWSV